jgi:hypothetical protein
MATYADKLRQVDGDLIAKIGSSGQISIEKNMSKTVTASVVQALDGTVAVAADALVIPVTHAIVTKTTGADAEALTLADGYNGQVLNINLVVDGNGDGTLTPATATGWATVVFADAGDAITVQFINATVGWIIIGAYGLTAQPTITV